MSIRILAVLPPRPTFTEESLPHQQGRVLLITGGASGIGFELAKILSCHSGKVYITGHTKEKEMQAIQASVSDHQGQLDFITLELNDLRSTKASGEAFKAKDCKLGIMWNNAGVSQPPLGSVSKQGHELQLAVNCLGPFLFTQMLLPLLDTAAASSSSPGLVALSSPPGGNIMSELTSAPKDNVRNYLNSKTGNWFLSAEFARRYGHRGIVSVALNPGAANTNLLKNVKLMKISAYPLLYKSVCAAHTELYAEGDTANPGDGISAQRGLLGWEDLFFTRCDLGRRGLRGRWRG
ncbi:hypothetical protein BDV12DRAFT_205669 [Aspergillus spectabilis]